MEIESEKPVYSFQEFRLMYESAERVTDRRLGMNRTNYTICLGVVIGIGLTTDWAVNHSEYFYWGMAAIMALTALGILFCIGWINQIRDFKNLNSAKFQVMAEMTAHMRFETEYGELPVSSRPFDREWEILQNTQNALTQHGPSKALSSTTVEYLLPRGLILVYGFCFVVAAILVLQNAFG